MDSVNLILSVPAVVAIVSLLKQFGVAGKWASLAAVLVGVGLYVSNYYLEASGVFPVAMQGLLIGLAAAGIYDTARAASSGPSQ